MARRWGRVVVREHPAVVRRQNRAAMLAMISDPQKRAQFERDFPEDKLPPLPKKRGPRSASGKPLERNVLRAIIQALRLDPRVASVERNQSGVFREGDRFIRVGTRGKLDLTCYLKDGRYIEIEVKRPGGKPKPHQAARIEQIRQAGGLAGYATSPEEALALLPC